MSPVPSSSLIKKGYRVEKKSIPLDARPLRIPCGKCEGQFTSEEDRKAHEVTRETWLLFLSDKSNNTAFR